MALVLEKNNASIVVRVGTILMAGDPGFREFEDCLHILARQGHKLVVIDFSDCIYLDSRAITAIISLNRRLKIIGGQLRIQNANNEISELLLAIQLNRIIEMV